MQLSSLSTTSAQCQAKLIMGRTDSWLARLLLAACALVIASALALGFGEFATRYRERHRTSVPGTMPMLFYRHSRLRFALVRNLDYFGWVRINGQGFRGPEVAIAKPLGVVRVMAVGGSTTFDGNVHGDDHTWPARLAYWLEQLDPGRQVEVINAGVPGYVVLDDIIRLQTDLCRFHPDVIVLYEGHNDLFAALRAAAEEPRPASDTPGEVAVQTPWGLWLAHHSLLYNKLLERWRAIRFLRAGTRTSLANRVLTQPLDDGIDRGAEQFEHDLSSFLVLARTFSIHVVLLENLNASGPQTMAERDPVVNEMWRRTMPFAPQRVVLAGYARYNAVIQQAARRFGDTFVSTRSFGLTGLQWYAEGDPIHFNDAGADRLGRRLAAALLDKHVLDHSSAH